MWADQEVLAGLKISVILLHIKYPSSAGDFHWQNIGMSGYHFFLISGYLDILDTDFFWILG